MHDDFITAEEWMNISRKNTNGYYMFFPYGEYATKTQCHDLWVRLQRTQDMTDLVDEAIYTRQ
jgi:hypothetical protein